MIHEPFADIGSHLIELLETQAEMPTFEELDFESAIKAFTYSYQVEESLLASGLAIIASPFSENDATAGTQDDCTCAWNLGVRVIIHSQIEKDITSPVRLHGKHAKLRELMALRDWMKRLFCSSRNVGFETDDQIVYRRVAVQSNEILDDDAIEDGDYLADLIVFYEQTEYREFADGDG